MAAVLELVRSHLRTGMGDSEVSIIIGKRPPSSRKDVITLMMLAYIQVEEGETGMININVYHEDQERIEELTVAIIEIMDMALIGPYLFTFDKQYNFRMSRTLHMSNVRVGVEKPTTK